MQSCRRGRTLCIHAYRLGVVLLLGLQEGLDFENLFSERREDDGVVVILALPPVVEILAALHDHRADFKGNERHEGSKVTNLVVLPTISINQRDTPQGFAVGDLVLSVDGFGAADFLHAVQELCRAREDLRLAVIHVAAVLGVADFGFAEHDGNRFSVGAHLGIPDKRWRRINFARVVVHVLVNGTGLSALSIAHVVVGLVWLCFNTHRPLLGSVASPQMNYTSVLVYTMG